MKIVFLDRDSLGEDSNIDCFEELGEVKIYGATSEDQILSRVSDADILLTNKVRIDKKIIDAASRLKYIGITATGTNNVDLDYAAQKGIAVTNVKGYSTEIVAQHTFALLLSLMEQIEYYDDYVKTGKYAKSGEFTHIIRPFHELSGKTWGIIGLGEIGSRVGTIAEAFGCNVIYFSTSGKNNHDHFKRVEFEELLSSSDIISVHAPLTPSTQQIINAAAFSKMKKTAYFINVGRGPIVDEEALAEALNQGEIAGAGLDVFAVEPMTIDNPILHINDKNKIIMTPHIAWAGIEARKRLIRELYLNIKAFQSGENRNKVN